MSNQLHTALSGHTPRQERTSNESVVKAFEQSWNSVKQQSVAGAGLTASIVLGSLYNMEQRARLRIITEVQFNNLHSIAIAAQANLTLIYSKDHRAQVLWARLEEARNRNALGVSGLAGWRSF